MTFLSTLLDTPDYLLHLIFKEDATFTELLYIALGFALLWGIIFVSARILLAHLTYGKPWLYAACERHYNRGGREELELLGFLDKGMSKEDAISKMMKDWPFLQVIVLQHLAGALFCVPSLLGVGDVKWANSLAACGILSEVGWEIESVFEFGYIRLFTKDGAKKVPGAFIFILAIHHVFASLLGLPMVLHYRNMKALHWLCFDLQFGALNVALYEYSKMLDISKTDDLRKFKFINLAALVVNLWTRAFHFIYIVVSIILVWIEDKAWRFLVFGALPILVFTFFNIFFSTIPSYKRYKKFINKSVEFESLPADAPEVKRRQSVAALELVANEILYEGTLNMTDRVGMFLETLESSSRLKVDRRQTMPARRMSKWKSHRLMRFESMPIVSTKED